MIGNDAKPVPVQPGERMTVLDALRGIALLGILLVNILSFSAPYTYWKIAGAVPFEGADLLAEQGILFFAEGKFYTMFSFLFGIGMVIFLQRAGEKHDSPAALYQRRLFLLLVFGILHAFFIWSGDILLSYAVVGFVLLLFRRVNVRKAAIWGFVFIVFGLVLYLVLTLPFLGTPNPEAVATGNELVQKALSYYGEGTYSEAVVMRFIDLVFMYSNFMLYFFIILGMFLLGMAAAKAGWLFNPREHVSFFRKVWVVSPAVGVPFAFLQVSAYRRLEPDVTTVYDIFYFSGYLIGGISLCFFYVSSVVLLYLRKPELFTPFVGVGRMALTNYLLQSLVFTFIFYGYGLGYYGSLPLLTSLVLAVGFYLLQVVGSAVWLRFFRYGPMEWLWRTFTYGRRLSLRKPGS